MKFLRKIKMYQMKELILVLLIVPQFAIAGKPYTIELKSTINLQYPKEGLKEPSGLTLSHAQDSLWVVSDNKNSIFKLGLDGLLKTSETISDRSLKGLEGIAISNDGLTLYVVKEDNNTIISVDIDNKMVNSEIQISQLHGYKEMVNDVSRHFRFFVSNNKGLEGITLHPKNGNIFLLKESGLLMEISYQEKTIIHYYDLKFADDYSGIAFEQVNKNRLWMISDESKFIYLYDLNLAKMVMAFPLKNEQDKSYFSAEGVTYDPIKKELYIVTDSKHKLMKYQVSD